VRWALGDLIGVLNEWAYATIFYKDFIIQVNENNTLVKENKKIPFFFPK